MGSWGKGSGARKVGISSEAFFGCFSQNFTISLPFFTGFKDFRSVKFLPNAAEATFPYLRPPTRTGCRPCVVVAFGGLAAAAVLAGTVVGPPFEWCSQHLPISFPITNVRCRE